MKTQKDQSASRPLPNSAQLSARIDSLSRIVFAVFAFVFAIFNSERAVVSSKIATIERWPELTHRLDRIFYFSRQTGLVVLSVPFDPECVHLGLQVAATTARQQEEESDEL